MHGDEGGEPQDPWESELGETLWVSDVDYIKGWSEAHAAATRLRDLVISYGIPAREVEAGARTGAGGHGVVRVVMSVEVTHWLMHVLRHADSDGPPGLDCCDDACRDLDAGGWLADWCPNGAT